MTASLPRRWSRFLQATQHLWERRPEVLSLHPMLATSPRGGLLLEELRALRGLAGFLLGSAGPGGTPAPRREVLLCCHSPAANALEPMTAVARRLEDAGVGSLLWSPAGVRFFPEEGADRGEALRAAMLHPAGRREALGLLARSARSALSVLAAVATSGRPELADLLLRPFQICHELSRSCLRLRAAGRILPGMGIRLAISTHERYPPAPEFLIAGAGRDLATLLYHHGTTNLFDIPVLAQEALVWNETDATMLERFCGDFPRPRFRVVGNVEVDLVMAREAGEEGGAVGAGPVLVFLSQYVTSVTEMPGAMERCLDWLDQAAGLRPRWRILVKERGHGERMREIYGRHPVWRNENVGVVPEDIDFARLLLDGEVRAVASFSSSGLHVAAGCGKPALRLAVRPLVVEDPVVDRVVENVVSPEGLAGALDRIEAEDAPRVPSADDFPWRGRTVERVAAICLERLSPAT